METNAMPLHRSCAWNVPCARRERRPSEGVDPPVRVHECPFCGFTTAYGAADYR